MPSDLFRGSKGGSGLRACFDKLSTRLPVWLARALSALAESEWGFPKVGKS